ncbi:MAG TPA: hypothetical protein VFT42_02835 [Solirubrobacteraceae bacterium]|nr:hypothetical protein [Solirubrobacteraceae bacterium]
MSLIATFRRSRPRLLRVALPIAILFGAMFLLAGPVFAAALMAVLVLAAVGGGLSGRGGGAALRKGEILRGQLSSAPRFDPAEAAVYDDEAWARVRERHDEKHGFTQMHDTDWNAQDI